jgi:hypothetical protein
VSIFGSEGFVTDGSTSPGPGFRRKIKGLLIENQMRPADILGIVAIVVEPSGPRRIVQSTARGVWTPDGEAGKYGVLPSAWIKQRAFPFLTA